MRASPRLDQTERDDDALGVPEQRRRGLLGGRARLDQRVVLRDRDLVVAKRVDPAALDLPVGLLETLRESAVDPLQLLPDGRRRVIQTAWMHAAEDAHRAHHRCELRGETAADRRDLRRRVDQFRGLRTDDDLAFRPLLDMVQVPIAEATRKRGHAVRIAPAYGVRARSLERDSISSRDGGGWSRGGTGTSRPDRTCAPRAARPAR